jgi:hypothetical protein
MHEFMVTEASTILTAPPSHPPFLITTSLKLTVDTAPLMSKQRMPLPSIVNPFPLMTKPTTFDIINVSMRVMLAPREMIAPDLISFLKSLGLVTILDRDTHKDAPEADNFPESHGVHKAELVSVE